jgi:hypothetical protein
VVALARALAAARLVIDVDIAATVDHAGCSRPPPSLPRRYPQIAGGRRIVLNVYGLSKNVAAPVREALPLSHGPFSRL